MNSKVLAIILAFVAGFSTLIGCLFMFFSRQSKTKALSFTFTFSFVIILFICIFDLAPSSYKYFISSSNYPFIMCILFILSGILFGKLVDKINIDSKKYDKKLYKVGIMSFLVLMLHNIPEGIITFITAYDNITFGLVMALAIAMHNIPEGIMISVPIYYSTGSRLKGFIYTLISSISEPFGALITWIFLSKFINDKILGIILAFVCGLMLHIVIDEIYPLTKVYKDKKYKILGLVLSIILIFFLHIFI